MELLMILPFGITDQHICGTQTILPIGITGSTHLWNSNNPSYWNYRINSMILPFRITDLGLYGVTNDPSFRIIGF